MILNAKKAVLVHELGHRILFRVRKTMTDSLERHKFLFLVLHDLIIELYGEDFAKETVAADNKLQDEYAIAWQWALGFDKERRKTKFQKMLNS